MVTIVSNVCTHFSWLRLCPTSVHIPRGYVCVQRLQTFHMITIVFNVCRYSIWLRLCPTSADIPHVSTVTNVCRHWTWLRLYLTSAHIPCGYDCVQRLQIFHVITIVSILCKYSTLKSEWLCPTSVHIPCNYECVQRLQIFHVIRFCPTSLNTPHLGLSACVQPLYIFYT